MTEGQRRLAAIMFTDMVGYTALGQRNESLSLALVEEQRKVIRPILSRHNGREVKTIGDAFLVEFPNAIDATRCAYDIQRALRELNLSFDPEKRIHLRIGIHVGEIVESQGDISGDAVNVASRIEPLAEEGGVCITSRVFDLIRGKVDLPLFSIGQKWLKNVAIPMEVYKMQMPWDTENEGRRERLDARRIAVLPFSSMSPDPNDEYFADGMTEELIDRLAQVKEVEVIARTSVMSYKKKEKKAAEIAKELGVGSLVEGSVRKAGNRIRVTAQLINANTEGHLWSSHYDGNLDDIFAVQSDIAEKVTKELQVRLLDSEKRAIEKKETGDMVAYSYFLQGNQLVNELEEDPLRQALSFFEQATARDPNFARAYVGITRCFIELADGGYVQWQEAIDRGKVAAVRALQVNPDLAEAHSDLAHIMMMADEGLDAVKAETTKALELNSNLEDAHRMLANILVILGETSEMVKAAEKAYELDPLSPQAIGLVGTAYFAVRRYEDALAHWRKTLYLEPYRTYRHMFDYYVTVGDYAQAEKAVKELERLGPTLEYTYLNRGYLAGVTGDEKTALEMISKLEAIRKPGWSRWYTAGFIYLALGNLDKFFDYMFRAVEDHTVPLSLNSSYLRYNPLVDKARSDPRFAEIFRRAGYPYNPMG